MCAVCLYICIYIDTLRRLSSFPFASHRILFPEPPQSFSLPQSLTHPPSSTLLSLFSPSGIPYFTRAVLLIRDPFDSIWSEFQRRVTKSHVEGIHKATFDWHRWQANAAQLSNEYNTMWVKHYGGIVKAYKKEDVLFVRYDNIKSFLTNPVPSSLTPP